MIHFADNVVRRSASQCDDAERRTTLGHRSGVTLIEVLVAIFVMSIGLLCVLTLFVLGVQRMATAFKDDGATKAVINARAIAAMKNVRNDPAIVAKLQNAGADDAPGNPVFVDPAGAISGGTLGSKIARVNPSFAPDNSPTSLQFFSLLDDITFQHSSGVPKLYGNNVEREIIYTWAYLVQRQRAGDPGSAAATVCVFQRRPKAGQLETEYPATMNPNDNTITVTGGNAGSIIPGMWVLDGTVKPGGNYVLGYFYRITAVRDTASGLALDLQTPLQGYGTTAANGQIVVLDGLIEVFDIGTNR